MTPYIPDTVMITGATGGLGTAFTQRFAQAGCKLILTSRSQEKLHNLIQNLDQTKIHTAILDVCDTTALTRLFDTLPEKFHNLDVLINNAGLALGLEPAYETDLQDWQTMINTNTKALVTCTHLALPHMVKRNHGHIINLGSTAGTYPYPGGNVYCATKAFVKQFSLALRADLLGKNIRVTNIEPGQVHTEFSRNRFKGDNQRAEKVYANTLSLTPNDIAETAFWIATLPLHININRIEMMPITQAFGPLPLYRFPEEPSPS